MLKLTRHLFALDPQARYIDYYERALFNHILGSIDPDSAMTIYFLSLRPGHFKVYCTPTDSFWCCTGTGVENHARYGEAIYFQKADTLWVNLFIASELRWNEKGLIIRQQTNFPQEQATTIALEMKEPQNLAIKLRIPSWAKSPSLTINRQKQPLKVEPDGFTTIDRRWKDGDRIELSLPMALHLYRAVDDADSVAILEGPIVLAGELGRVGLPVSDQAGDQNQFNKLPAPPVPALPAACRDPGAALAPVEGKPLTFRMKTAGTPGDVELIPLYQLHHQRYTVYWKLPAGQE
jgi:DUF1680 family protein